MIMTACGKMPTKTIDEVKAVIDEITKAGADKYAANDLKMLNDNLQAALDEANAQDKKFFKKFGKVNELLAQVKTDAEALKAALPAKIEEAKNSALQLLTEAKTAGDEAKALIDKAPKSSKTKAAIDAFTANLKGLEDSMPEVQAAIDGQDYLGAAEKAKAIKEKAAGFVDEFKAAIEKITGKKI
jgi:uncharacterized protein (DUF3084 family)